MEPFYLAFYSLKSMLTNINVEIKEDDYILEPDDVIEGMEPGDYDMTVLNLVHEGDYFTKRYDVKVSGVYHKVFADEFVNTFNSFNEEIRKNLSSRALREVIPDYLDRLKQELTRLFDDIIEHEITYNSHKIWIYLPKSIDKEFLNSNDLQLSMIENISSFFSFMKERIIDILDDIAKIETKEQFLKEDSELPDEAFSEVVNPNSTGGALDIYQTALLFYYLKKFKGINPHNYTSLARLVSFLTGHSFQNIRTEKGFGAIGYILSDKAKNQHFINEPNYNLNVLKEFLQKIIDDLNIQAKKNHPELTKK